MSLVFNELNTLITDFSLNFLFTSILGITIVYFVGRFIGKGVGSWTTANLSSFPEKVKNNLPLSLITQAGVAIGLAGLVFNELTAIGKTEEANLILLVTTLSVIISEIIGPLLLKKAIFRAGEANVDIENNSKFKPSFND